MRDGAIPGVTIFKCRNPVMGSIASKEGVQQFIDQKNGKPGLGAYDKSKGSGG